MWWSGEPWPFSDLEEDRLLRISRVAVSRRGEGGVAVAARMRKAPMVRDWGSGWGLGEVPG